MLQCTTALAQSRIYFCCSEKKYYIVYSRRYVCYKLLIRILTTVTAPSSHRIQLLPQLHWKIKPSSQAWGLHIVSVLRENAKGNMFQYLESQVPHQLSFLWNESAPFLPALFCVQHFRRPVNPVHSRRSRFFFPNRQPGQTRTSLVQLHCTLELNQFYEVLKTSFGSSLLMALLPCIR